LDELDLYSCFAFIQKLWEVNVEDGKLTFSCSSKDGEEGYPGDVIANGKRIFLIRIKNVYATTRKV